MIYKPIYVDELFSILHSASDEIRQEVIERLNQTNREVVKMLIGRIGESRNIGFIRILNQWKLTEVKKVQAMINEAITKLKSV